MTSYTVTGHPLNVYQAIQDTDAEPIRTALQSAGVGTTINITLSGSSDTKIKGHGALK